MDKKLTLKKIFSRVNLPISFEKIGLLVAKEFNLGTLKEYSPMMVGYEELNSLLITSEGKFVVKIFSKDKNLKIIESNIFSITNLLKNGIPVPKLCKNLSGNYLFKIKNHNTQSYLCVMKYFDGKKFTEVNPTEQDLKNLVTYLARINNLHFKAKINYDPWLTINLEKEFNNKKSFLNKSSQKLVEKVVKDVLEIDKGELGKGIVHFDLHRENAMKNKSGQYCILDLASCNYNYTIFDLATFIALFCFDPSRRDQDIYGIYNFVLGKYQAIRKISEYELSILPALIKATYASNLLIASYLQKDNQDENPEQTAYYKSLGRNGLKLILDLNLK